MFYQPSPHADRPTRQAITAAWRTPEPGAVAAVLPEARLPAPLAQPVQQLARRVAQALRDRQNDTGKAGLVQGLLQAYALSSQEGVALMCLAEALLRIPDAASRDALIRDKIGQGHWQPHLHHSPSLFVNAATWGLLLTGKLVATHSEAGLGATLGRLLAQGGAPLVRKGVDMAMRLMGERFVTGETIADALAHARSREAEGFRYSFDMLGEAALTAQDAARYQRGYETAIHAIGLASGGRGVYAGPGISIKLSALHPRYSVAQQGRVVSELYPVLVGLCALAKRYGIGLNIDAEEADRLELSLDLLEGLCFEPQLQGWPGLGFVIQAYQKRCPAVVDHLIDLARRSQRRLMVRLVKGAYWDTEIKRAQVEGQPGYPVYTRKVHTDVSYVACARRLLAAPDAVYPQFATHNAQTLAAVYHLADPSRYHPEQYEFQCLHGMGEPLYEQVVGPEAAGGLNRPCRIYAPVGTHETLLAYLVRRLLENGANTSFVHQIADPTLPIEQLVQDPVTWVEAQAGQAAERGAPHPGIPLPEALYGDGRRNAAGWDLANPHTLQVLAQGLNTSAQRPWTAEPLLAQPHNAPVTEPVTNPANRTDTVGHFREATPAEVDVAVQQAVVGAPLWAATPPARRAEQLRAVADLLEVDTPVLVGLLAREAGKTAANAVAEVREAVDFLRYYAQQVAVRFDNQTHIPLGPVVCISPWNFPLAIFTGQVAAALAAGNVVLAKPAETTPLVAAQAVRLFWAAGVPRQALQLVTGRGAVVGQRLVANPAVQGVLFTGSTGVARQLQKALVGRLTTAGTAVPLVAETGGQNAMVVDSSALAEQVVADVVASAFDSAGQRCSALRVLCVQEEVADRTLDMLLGAMAELVVGDPAHLSTDVGPVIDGPAQRRINNHIQTMREAGHRVHQVQRAVGMGQHPLDAGTFVLPTVIEINHIGELTQEVFGPVLHVLRYRREGLAELLHQVNATGYALTMGVHTRIDETVDLVARTTRAGNLYVNRNMVGAVVGVQPFGGEGLSGTGPKAGGPLYLDRLLARKPPVAWVGAMARHREGTSLAGPTGERNTYHLAPRERVLCLASQPSDRLAQLAAVHAVGGRAVWPVSAQVEAEALAPEVRATLSWVQDWTQPGALFDAVLLHGSPDELARVQRCLVARPGPVVPVERLAPGDTAIPLERLVVERAVSVNTAAAGGNASLMTLASGG